MTAPVAALHRAPGWRGRLARWAAEVGARPFGLGAHDCALLAAGAVLAMTGTDLGAPFRGRYRTVAGGLRAVRRAGFADAEAVFAARFRARAPGEIARPGDVAVIATPEGRALGVVQGAAIWLAGPAGLVLAPLNQAVSIYEVP